MESFAILTYQALGLILILISDIDLFVSVGSIVRFARTSSRLGHVDGSFQTRCGRKPVQCEIQCKHTVPLVKRQQQDYKLSGIGFFYPNGAEYLDALA